VRAGVPALAVVVCALAGCGVTASRERAVKTRSMANLKQIYQALTMFAAEKSSYPKTLEELVPDQLVDDRVLASPTKPGLKGYGYVSGLDPKGPVNIIAFDLKHNFEGGRNVLASNGDVAWMIEEKFQEGLARTIENAKSAGREAAVIE
jgi:hypothetical protein